MNFTPELETALLSFAQENNIEREEAVGRILRDWLVQEGYMFSGEEGIPPEKLNASNDG
ncbi:hypothetical protein G6L28_04975 [Agrobacterium larrymoorei]|uniref:hypothetical protein n=1 Tax=Agrobacterium larrymoorei TaxID=160699 RepID=UPI0015745411|nr:hypothetical protein [Agrobacterium larrymoorei]NTJ41954.1 hypothetical protein [Agrobacterium larrymoorei]